jgi:DNA-binding MarR family transcriptional regulator
MNTAAHDLTSAAQDIRRCFQLLRTIADALHEEHGVTASMRAVMEHLAAHGATTVPQIARQKFVTRQHIQMIVDGLLARGLVTLKENVAHKRSPLVALSEQGAKLFDLMRAKEKDAFTALARKVRAADARSLAQLLQQFRGELAQLASRYRAEEETSDD